MAINIDALASQAAAQGQQMLQSDQNNAANYRGQYNSYQQQADAANQAVKNYTDYMQGAGSAGNQYDQAFNQQKQDLGYDPAQMTAARSNLNAATGALSAYSDFASQAASKWGMNAGGFAAANSGALSGLNNNIASNQNVVNGLSDLYKTAQTGANQKTGLVIQGEQNTLGGLNQTFQNLTNLRDSAASQMQFYEGLAANQGHLNSQQQSDYAAAKNAYAAAQASIAQAGLYAAQAAQTRQQTQYASDLVNKYGVGSLYNYNPQSANNGYTPTKPTPNASNGNSLYNRISGDLAEGALNVGRWGWTDTLGKIF